MAFPTGMEYTGDQYVPFEPSVESPYMMYNNNQFNNVQNGHEGFNSNTYPSESYGTNMFTNKMQQKSLSRDNAMANNFTRKQWNGGIGIGVDSNTNLNKFYNPACTPGEQILDNGIYDPMQLPLNRIATGGRLKPYEAFVGSTVNNVDVDPLKDLAYIKKMLMILIIIIVIVVAIMFKQMCMIRRIKRMLKKNFRKMNNK